VGYLFCLNKAEWNEHEGFSNGNKCSSRLCRDLEEIKGRDVMAYSISAKNNVNIDKVLDWLIKHAGKSS
jgi:hypothetical protein